MTRDVLMVDEHPSLIKMSAASFTGARRVTEGTEGLTICQLLYKYHQLSPASWVVNKSRASSYCNDPRRNQRNLDQ